MPILSIKLKTVSPLFLNGADKGKPELRAASVRGQLHYWLRAIEGAKTTNLKDVWEAEEAIFGSSTLGSQISIRFYSKNGFETKSARLLPHSSEKNSSQVAIRPQQLFQLDIVPKVGQEIPEKLKYVLYIWFLLGGLGKRSRRMMGAFDSYIWGKEHHPHTPEKLQDLTKNLLNLIIGAAPENIPTPSYPTLHPRHSRIVVTNQLFESAQEANIELFDILRSDEFRKNERVFGHAQGGRRASPLIAQVRQMHDKYCGILTIMRSEDINDSNWKILNDFLNRYSQKFEGKTVWGNE